VYAKTHILFFVLAICNTGKAQNDSLPSSKNSGFLRSTLFCQPFVSDLESYKPQIEVNYASNCEEYDLSETCKQFKLFQNIHLGTEIPYYSYFRYKNASPHFGWGINSTISFHMWWDPLEISTSPILNTDYHFESIVLKYIHFLNGKRIKNLSLKFAPFNHESTHLGDELALYRSRKNYPITRVNVSYEYSEMNFTINDPCGLNKPNHSFRIGIKYRINGSQDYYTVSSKEGDSTLAVATGLKGEYYAEYNVIRNKGILTNRRWVNVFSIELRNRPMYNYPRYSSADGTMTKCGVGLKRCSSLNMYFGFKYIKPENHTLGIYLHLYTGQNPNGQFRNRTNFQSLGLTFVLE
jgi:hypothetical protein